MLCIAAVLVTGCSRESRPDVSADKVRDYANALYNRELYEQAVQEYQRYLDTYHTDEQERANINFIIGNIYFERLHDYENAMAAYLKVKHIFPESTIRSNADKQIVACLERLQRSADAKQALDEATSLDPGQIKESRPGAVVAKIGDRKITSGDLKHQISQMPDYMQSQFQNREAKIEYLKHYVATELFYEAAKRMGLDDDKEVIEGTFQAKKGLMVQQYLAQKIASQVKINPEDVELYYQANLEKYTEKDDKGKVKRQKSFSEVRQQAAEDLIRERQQKAYDALFQDQLRTEKVEVYDDRIQ